MSDAADDAVPVQGFHRHWRQSMVRAMLADRSTALSAGPSTYVRTRN